MKRRFDICAVLALLSLAVALVSCSSKKRITEKVVNVHDTTYITERYVDTAIVFEADTATAGLLAECDENNRVLIHQLNTIQGSRVNVDPVIKYVPYIDEDGVTKSKAYIDIVATAEAMEEKIQIYEKTTARLHSENEKLKEDYSKESGKWIYWFLTGFALAMAVCFVLLIFLWKWIR